MAKPEPTRSLCGRNETCVDQLVEMLQDHVLVLACCHSGRMRIEGVTGSGGAPKNRAGVRREPVDLRQYR